MTLSEESKNLSVVLDGMRDKTKALQDSLKGLAENGIDPLFSALTQALAPAQRVTMRKPAGDIISNTFESFARQEIPTVLGSIFGKTEPRAAPTGQQSSGINVIINNNASASVSAREISGTNDQKYLEITIDQMVANSLLRGRQTSGVLRSLFGLVPDLTGR